MANYNVSSTPVNVTVSGAKDTHGNVQVSYTKNNAFSINAVTPSVAITSAPNIYLDTQNSITVSGTGTIGASISLVICDTGGHKITVTTTVGSSGTWSISGINTNSLTTYGKITYKVTLTTASFGSATNSATATKYGSYANGRLH